VTLTVMAALSEQQLRTIIREELSPLEKKVAGIETKVAGIETKVAGIETKVAGIETKVAGIEVELKKIVLEAKIQHAKQLNAAKPRDEILERVPLPDSNGEEKYPRDTGNFEAGKKITLSHLLVAGNEKLPSGETNVWNANKSLSLIREYDPGYLTDDEDAPATSRKRRLKLAQCLGITPTQLNMSSMQINWV